MAAPSTRQARDPKRLLGIDRSSPEPEATRAGQPLRPWTLPNCIGYARLAGTIVFLVVALRGDTGRNWHAAALFAIVGWSDYLDGFTARLTGQYSRMGALLDPIVDRMLVVSGMVVCWKFTLLPRWAIALVVIREVLMLAISRFGLSRGIDIEISWIARFGVPPTMGAPFFAMVGVHWLALVLLYCGLALTWTATVLYVRHGLQALRKLSSST